MTKSLVTISIILAAATSAAVSRVGGGSVSSQRTGFSARLPAENLIVGEERGEDGLLVLKGHPFMTGKGLREQWLLLQDFDRQYLSLKEKSLEALQQELRNRGYSMTGVTEDCVYFWRKETPGTRILLAVWGPGRGLSMTGTDTTLTREAQRLLVETLTLQGGSCGWK